MHPESKKRPRSQDTEETSVTMVVGPSPDPPLRGRLTPAELWACADCSTWALYAPTSGPLFQTALATFRSSMKKAPTLDVLFEGNGEGMKPPSFHSSQFSASPAAGSPPSPTPVDAMSAAVAHNYLVQLMQRKMQRGVFRPGLLQQVQSNPAPAVLSAIAASLALFQSECSKTGQGATPSCVASFVVKCLKPLVALRGVGPATASLVASRFILQEGFPHQQKLLLACAGTTRPSPPMLSGFCPFMSDEAASIVLQTPVSKLKYNLAELTLFIDRLWEKHMALLEQSAKSMEKNGSDKDTGMALSPDALAHALWAVTVLHTRPLEPKK